MKLARATVAAVLLAAPLGIAGCWGDPALPQANWQARLVDGELQIAACAAMVGDSITANRENQSGERWTRFWHASGNIDVPEGGVLVAGLSDGEVETDFYEPGLLDFDSAFTVYLYRDGSTQAADFQLAPTTQVGHWTAPDGAVSAEPCAY